MIIKLFEGKGPIIPIVVVTMIGITNQLWARWNTTAIARYENLVNLSAIFLTALTLYSIGKKLNATTSRTLQDPATGNTVIIKQRHTFLGGSADTWAYVLGGFAIYALVHGLYTGSLFKT